MVEGPGELQARLERERREYELFTPASGREVRLAFVGPFAGAPVVWEARISALGRGNLPRFIDIPPAAGPRRPVHVGLDVDAVDAATVLKTVMMLRRYKRLQEGRHTFGAPENSGA